VLELPRRSMRAAARIVGVNRERKRRAAAPSRRS
jgi:hypothetical protein